MKNAPIIILDEATANVDPENEAELQKAIEALTNGKTIIMIGGAAPGKQAERKITEGFSSLRACVY